MHHIWWCHRPDHSTVLKCPNIVIFPILSMISFLSGRLSNFGLNLTKRNCHCLTHQPAPGGKLASLFRSLSVRQQTTFLRRHSLKCILIIKIKTKIGNLKFSSSSHSIISHSNIVKPFRFVQLQMRSILDFWGKRESNCYCQASPAGLMAFRSQPVNCWPYQVSTKKTSFWVL